jgi:hypothetical protein
MLLSAPRCRAACVRAAPLARGWLSACWIGELRETSDAMPVADDMSPVQVIASETFLKNIPDSSLCHRVRGCWR